MQNQSDKSRSTENICARQLALIARRQRRAAFARRAIFIISQKRKDRLQARLADKTSSASEAMNVKALTRKEFDPELLYVECGRCGSPVLWPDGKATALLREAGIDPLELDSSCMLVTDACPACGARDEYAVRIFRVAANGVSALPTAHGNA